MIDLPPDATLRPAAAVLRWRPSAGALRRSRRAQSEVTGTMLMAGVVAVAVTVAGGLLLVGYLDGVAGGPTVDLDATANETHVTLHHAGGEGVPLDELTVILRADGSEHDSRLAAWSQDGDGDERFQPAERASRNATALGYDAGPVEVLVVHRRSERLLLDETVRLGAEATEPTTTTGSGPN